MNKKNQVDRFRVGLVAACLQRFGCPSGSESNVICDVAVYTKKAIVYYSRSRDPNVSVVQFY